MLSYVKDVIYNVKQYVIDRISDRLNSQVVHILARQSKNQHNEILQLREENARLRHEARTDPLTGMFNRLAFSEYYKAERGRIARKQSKGAVVVVIDLNDFKPVNDTYGHDAGDQALVKVGETLRAFIRATDCAARLGGDEFALLLTNCDTDDVKERVDTLTDTFASLSIKYGGDTIPIRAAIGSKTMDHEASMDRVLHMADSHMYAQKTGSRNVHALRAANAA